ncbi:protoporphyrinogen oxidase [Nocardiopsis suaedae]|uniref:Coproporphyrinogen III oxidase n=1 Tax=Nocardiopsis suaedae TaxID=3018444 RepID=A0ABT4TUJ5_9ACTN|nr:protoporphyrinogen oxidase [Nocardiopsis suaedae]MDA2808374.1 protoporphyrinogen oxidase [Nocardiopsis suaedae]
MQTRPHVAVVGGGLAGLTAAYRLARGGAGVTLLEAGPRAGGKLHASPVAGVPVDAGAESVLARRPEALDLISELGLDDRVEHPAPAPARIYSRGRLRAFPAGQVMGVPGDLRALARSGVLSWGGTLRAALDLVLPGTPVRGDVPVGAYLSARMGTEVVDRLVEPMLGGVYAGRTDRLSLDSALPQIAPVARSERSLARGVAALKRRQAAAAGDGPPAPVFATLRGGLAVLVDALAEQAEKYGADLRTGAPVRSLSPGAEGGWVLEADGAGRVAADAVVLACPAPAASRLLAGAAPDAARELGGIGYASMAITTFAFRAADLPPGLGGSGFLVSPREGLTIKAATFSSLKWPWLKEALDREHPGEDLVVVRCSIGRAGEEEALRRTDGELADTALADLRTVCGPVGAPVERRVTRWDGGLPQYDTGHAARVRRARAAVAAVPPVALCGAAYDGVGIPTCIASATGAAEELLTAGG